MMLGTPSCLTQSSGDRTDTTILSSSSSSLRSSRRLKLPMVSHSITATTSTSINSYQPNSFNRPVDNHNNHHSNSSSHVDNLPFLISCADTVEARSKIWEMSGKIKSDQRKLRQLLATYATSDLSLWLPPHIDITTVSLSCLLYQIVDSSSISIYPVNVSLIDEYTDPTQNGRKSRTFRIQYSNTAPSTTALTTTASMTTSTNVTALSPTVAAAVTATVAAAITAMAPTTADAMSAPAPELILRDQASKVHTILYQCIPIAFPGAQCR